MYRRKSNVCRPESMFPKMKTEDTIEDQPFATGCTINEIQLSNFSDPQESRKLKGLCCKNVEIEEYVIYLAINLSPGKWFSNTKSHEEILGRFNNIADHGSARIVVPISCTTKAKQYMQPGKNNCNPPKYLLDYS